MTTDQDLDVALALFNDGLERQKADRRAAKAIENAEKTKQEAATTLKRLQSDSGASAEDRAAAEAAYREAVTTFNALRNGEAPPATDETDETDETDDDAGDSDEAGEAAAGSDMAAAAGDDAAEALAETADAEAPPADAAAEDETAG
jgi:hypothetical protein